MNKKKIINDPVYGFVRIPYEIIFDLIEHPYFQRLRRIKQLGLSSYVYPGAVHTRFHHAIGAMHLMTLAIEVLRSKRTEIDPTEAEAVTIAILLHDIGHGPFSHALEHSLADKVSHEALSLLFMERLNTHFSGRLSLAMEVFKGSYHKAYLHQLVSSQLDMDRMDYLNRDSFFSGVDEGQIGFERIIKMLAVQDEQIVVEHKGIYSVEQFLIARRLMYWQVYLHKTVVAAEAMLVKVLQRAKELTQEGETLFASPALQLFLRSSVSTADFATQADLLDQFALLDDTDIEVAVKTWQYHSDRVLSYLAAGLSNRHLLKIEMDSQPIDPQKIADYRQQIAHTMHLSEHEASYLVFDDQTSNSAYSYKGTQINMALKDGSIQKITEASDYLNVATLALPIVKYYWCFPKNVLHKK